MTLSSLCEALRGSLLLPSSETDLDFSACHRFIEKWDEGFTALLQSYDHRVASDASIHPTAIVAPDVYISAGVEIGPFCYIRSKTFLGPNVRLGYGVEVDRAIIFDRTRIAHQACIGRSVIGENCNLSFNFVNATANIYGGGIYYHLGNGGRVRSSALHHGAVIGARFRAAVNVSTMPGCSVSAGYIARPSEVLKGFVG